MVFSHLELEAGDPEKDGAVMSAVLDGSLFLQASLGLATRGCNRACICVETFSTP